MYVCVRVLGLLETVMNYLPLWVLPIEPVSSLSSVNHIFFYFLESATDQDQDLHTYILNKLFP